MRLIMNFLLLVVGELKNKSDNANNGGNTNKLGDYGYLTPLFISAILSSSHCLSIILLALLTSYSKSLSPPE